MNFLRISFLHFSIPTVPSRSRVQGNGANERGWNSQFSVWMLGVRLAYSARLGQTNSFLPYVKQTARSCQYICTLQDTEEGGENKEATVSSCSGFVSLAGLEIPLPFHSGMPDCEWITLPTESTEPEDLEPVKSPLMLKQG